MTPKRKPKALPMKRLPVVSIDDLERVMGRKADHVSGLTFDPDSMSFSRTITFKLDEKP